MLLAQHPEAEAKLHAELDHVLAGRAPTLADLPNLPWTEMVIKESMRLYPPAWGFGRRAIVDIEIDGFHLPKDCEVYLSPYHMHRHPALWPDPERFDPERFSPEREAAIPRMAYLPFSTGPRVCIGSAFAMMEARLLLAALARRWQLRLLSDQPIQPEPMITLRPSEGLRMRVQARQAPALRST
jgi:cytochrome P450